MKRLIIALFATSAMGFALPALAHPEHAEDAGVQQSWNNGGDTYAEFDQESAQWRSFEFGAEAGETRRCRTHRMGTRAAMPVSETVIVP